MPTSIKLENRKKTYMENELIKITLDTKQATLLDLQKISRDTVQVLVLLSILENIHDKSGQELIDIIKNAHPRKKSIFIYREKIQHYVNENIDRFNFVAVENGSIILTIKVSMCIYEMIKIFKTKEAINKKKLLIQALKCIADIVNSASEIEELINIVFDQYGTKLEDFFNNYEVDI